MASTTRGRYRDALAVPEFRAIFLSHLCTMVATVAAEFALAVLIFTETGSPLLSALVFAIGFVPHLASAVLLSAVVDRVRVRRLMVGCNIISAVLATAMTVPGTPVAVLLGLAFALGLVGSVFAGTRAATLPDVLTDAAYVPARSLLRLVALGAMTAGFAGGGLLLSLVSPQTALLANGTCFLVSAILLRTGTIDRPPRMATERRLLNDSLAGVRAVLGVRPLRRVLLLSWLVPMIGVVPEALAVPYAASVDAGSAGAGLLLGSVALGTVAGELAGTWLLTPEQQVRIVIPLALFVFAPLALFLFRPGAAVAMALMFASGFGFAHHLGLDRLLLAVCPHPLQARALSIQSAGLMFCQGLGFALAGGAAHVVPLPILLTSSAACGLIIVIALRTPPAQHRLQRDQPALANQNEKGGERACATATDTSQR